MLWQTAEMEQTAAVKNTTLPLLGRSHPESARLQWTVAKSIIRPIGLVSWNLAGKPEEITSSKWCVTLPLHCRPNLASANTICRSTVNPFSKCRKSISLVSMGADRPVDTETPTRAPTTPAPTQATKEPKT